MKEEKIKGGEERRGRKAGPRPLPSHPAKEEESKSRWSLPDLIGWFHFLAGVRHQLAPEKPPSDQAMMMRTLVVAMMLASASSFAPSPKTQLATRRPAQAAPRVMPAMKLEPGNPLYYIGFPSQCQKDDMIREVCPYHYAPLWSPIASLELLASLELAPGVPRLPGAPSPP